MSYLAEQDEIVARLRTLQHVDVHEGHLSDEEFAVLLEGSDQIKPFITVSFGGNIKARTSVRGITGAVANGKIGTIVIRAVASTDRTSRQVLELADTKILGFSPTACGEIDHELFGGVGLVSALGNPTRYSAVQSYSFLRNMV